MPVFLTHFPPQIQDLAGQNENGSVVLPVSDTSNTSSHSEDVEGNSGDILNDPSLCSNFLQYSVVWFMWFLIFFF